jgi:uroporphyrinogen-III synthase
LHVRQKVVGILETRTGAHLAELIARRGAIPLLAPALSEDPDVDPEAIRALLALWRSRPMSVALFQTGVGTRALFQATDSLGLTQDLLGLLAATTVVVRGPKPVGELNARGVRIDLRASAPFTTADVLQKIAGIDIAARDVFIQRYGAANQELRAALEARGARVHELATYRWSLPADTAPLAALLGALAAGRVDAVVFTSAIQVANLLCVAASHQGAAAAVDQLNRCVIGSIGPVCSSALRGRGIEPTFEADPPKLGPLVNALEIALR